MNNTFTDVMIVDVMTVKICVRSNTKLAIKEMTRKLDLA